jgi:SAM-dependent methyltransferase
MTDDASRMAPEPPAETDGVEEFWDDLYQERPQVWSGKVNPVLADVAATLTPGTVLDLGCGEGGDAIWLAEQGWQVTAVDVSGTALGRAAAQAAAVGVDGRISFAQHDLSATFPEGEFDLVSAQFLHSPVELPRGEILRRAAGAVAAGGCLLVVGHAEPPPWARHHHDADGHQMHFPTADDVIGDLALDEAHWVIERRGTVEREATGPDGQTGVLIDSVVLARRLVD